MDSILDGKPEMTIEELITSLEKGPIKAEDKNGVFEMPKTQDGEYILDDSGLKPYSVDDKK
ncbi:hypothetical protein ACTNBM_13885 [Lachnospiraceae bacterium HCP1S3_C3]